MEFFGFIYSTLLSFVTDDYTIYKDWKIRGNGMKIIIAGAGKVGKTLTKELSADGYEITLIDKNPIDMMLLHMKEMQQL